MARYTDADCKRCRREKMKLFLKGSKCESPKCPFEKRPYPPGQHGRGRSKESEYLLQLREKQKATRMYGILEKQFSNYYKEAQRQPGKTGENLLQILESTSGQRCVPCRVCQEPRHGAPVGHPRSHDGERQEGRHSFLPRAPQRRHRRSPQLTGTDPIHRGPC